MRSFLSQLEAEVYAWSEGLRSWRSRLSDWWWGFSRRRTWAEFRRVHGYMCDDEKHWIISSALSSNRGRHALAMAMVVPIRRALDYQSVARKIFFVDELPQGALARYDIASRAMEMATDAIKAEEDERVLSHLRAAA